MEPLTMIELFFVILVMNWVQDNIQRHHLFLLTISQFIYIIEVSITFSLIFILGFITLGLEISFKIPGFHDHMEPFLE